MASEKDQKTLQDLFRIINDMRGEMNTRFERVDARFDDIRGEMNARFKQVDARFGEAAVERQAMRTVIDSLASQEDFAALDRKISAVSADTQATRQATQDVKAEVSRLRGDVKAAGIPVR